MKKILYLMGVDWYWIKQRPQILAEYLAQDYDITVAYVKEIFCRQELRKDKDELEKSIAVPVFPYRDKNRLIHGIQKLMFQKVMKKADEFDIIWIGQPLLYNYIPQSYKGKIVYDCMDNHEALCADRRIKMAIQKTEKELIRRADVIFASSTGLLDKVKISGTAARSLLVRNGVQGEKIYPPEVQQRGTKYKIGYFGTIAEWFDFSLLKDSLEKFPDIEYHLWGPVQNVTVPQTEGLIWEGVVEHRHLAEKVRNMDCLIMPFILNDIISDVDPVKLYEYISMGKNIISVKYREVKRFEKFVYFYRDSSEYLDILKTLTKSGGEIVYTVQEQQEFLKRNSWDNRYESIKRELDSL